MKYSHFILYQCGIHAVYRTIVDRVKGGVVHIPAMRMTGEGSL